MKKREKWLLIDQKLIKKYQTNKSKGQRHRLRDKGLASTFYLRFDDVALLLHTLGELQPDIKADDVHRRIQKVLRNNGIDAEILGSHVSLTKNPFKSI
ncbi:MAG: hypothetical protein HPY50_19435 [Firmicutes bacterium]|nr:hypothetical protein [Bacillota bacterium]